MSKKEQCKSGINFALWDSKIKFSKHWNMLLNVFAIRFAILTNDMVRSISCRQCFLCVFILRLVLAGSYWANCGRLGGRGGATAPCICRGDASLLVNFVHQRNHLGDGGVELHHFKVLCHLLDGLVHGHLHVLAESVGAIGGVSISCKRHMRSRNLR